MAIRSIHPDQLDPVTRAANFGDGLTLEARFRRGMIGRATPAQIDALYSQLIAIVHDAVACGKLTPIVSEIGVVGYLPGHLGHLLTGPDPQGAEYPDRSRNPKRSR